MIYSHKYKFVYLAPIKTGSTTLEHALKENFEACLWDFTGLLEIRESHNDPLPKIWPRHIMHIPESIKDYFVFASIRNPFKHTLSQYLNRAWVKKLPTSTEDFENYSKNHTLMTFYNCLNIKEEYVPPPGCFKFKINQYLNIDKNPEDSFNDLPFVDTPIKLLKLKKTHNHNVKFTSRSVNYIIEKRKIDFEFFNFDLELPKDLKC